MPLRALPRAPVQLIAALPATLLAALMVTATCCDSAPGRHADLGDASPALDSGRPGDARRQDGPSTGADAAVDAGADAGPPPSGRRVLATVKDLVVADVSQGWASASYVAPLGKFLTIFVNHYSPGGYQNNSLRAFDPVTGTVEVLHPKDVPGAPQDRDNHEMLYNPFLKQIWALGASHVVLDVMKAYAGRSTPPSYGAVGWSAELDNPAFATAVGIQGWPAEFRKYNAVVDWHPTLDIGVIWGGVAYCGMGVSNDLYLIQPNPVPGAERYVFVNAGNFDSVLAPPGYVQNYIYNTTFNGRHNGRIIGDHLYTLSVENTSCLTDLGNGKYSIRVDLLRLALTGATGAAALTKMAPLVYTVETAPGAPAPAGDEGMNFPCLTYDRKLNLLLAYLTLPPPHNLWAYLPDRDEWVEVEATPPAGRRRLAACDYSPDHALHAYLDGETDRTTLGWGTISLQRLD